MGLRRRIFKRVKTELCVFWNEPRDVCLPLAGLVALQTFSFQIKPVPNQFRNTPMRHPFTKKPLPSGSGFRILLQIYKLIKGFGETLYST